MKYAIISEDISGPAYGIGTTEAAARINAVESGFRKDAGISVEITEASFLAIEAGDPDAIELI
tara:strand:+ start:2100 stop:2288 length:189 start_codon:yes stop_codon:yes gene_type:complete